MARRQAVGGDQDIQKQVNKFKKAASGVSSNESDEDLKNEQIRQIVQEQDDSESSDGQGPDHDNFVDNMLESNKGRERFTTQNSALQERPTPKAKPKQSDTQDAQQEFDEDSDGAYNDQFSSDSEEESKKQNLRVNHLGIIFEAVGHHVNGSDEDPDYSSESSSDGSDEEVNEKLLKISKSAENQMIKISTAMRVMILDRADPVALVGLHEEQIQQTQHTLIKAANLLTCYEKDFYDIKRQILEFMEVPQMSHQLYEENSHPYFGTPSCVRIFRAKSGTFLFIGNSSGYIQVFDVQTQKQRKPLFVPQLARNEVMSIDISDNGQYLFAGYKKGVLAVWDCTRFRLAHLMADVARDEQSAFSCVKYLFTDPSGIINLVSAEESGRMRLVQLHRKMLGKFQHVSSSLLKNVVTIDVQKHSRRPDAENESASFCQQACLTAFGAVDTVTIVDMKKQDERRPIKIIQRPPICYDKAIPTLSWGYGLTPSDRQNSRPLLAIAWDKVIKLECVNDESQDLELEVCGFYCSDFEINQVYFITDSVLAIVVNADEVKILGTDRFKPGDIHMITKNKQPNEVKKEFAKFVQSSKACELEKGHQIQSLYRRAIMIEIEKTKQIATYFNLDNTICQYRRNMAFICSGQVIFAKVASWQDLMDRLADQGEDWLTLLKVAIQIYNGDIRGFAMLPAAQKKRKAYMQDYMKNLLKNSIEDVVNKHRQSSRQSQVVSTPSSQQTTQGSFSIEDVAIKVAIEFCLAISDVCFLFGDMYNFFEQKGLSQQFVNNLCGPILAGSFQHTCVPQDLLIRLIKAEEEKREFQTIEQIILNINMTPYNGKVNQQGQSIRKILKQVCQKHCLIGAALLLLQTSQNQRVAKHDCTLVLDMLLNTMETQKANFELALGRNENPTRITKEDMRMLKYAKKIRKQEIEQSAYYVGYKLFWILGLFLKGKKFPTGQLDQKQYRVQVLNIIDFVTNEDNLAAMLDFDSESFFMAMVELFTEKPWEFLTNHGKYKFAFERNAGTQDDTSAPKNPESYDESGICTNIPIANKILTIFKQAAERSNRKEPVYTKASFKEFLLSIAIRQEKHFTKNGLQKNTNGIQQIKLNYDLILEAIKSLFKTKHHGDKSVVADDSQKPVIKEFFINEAIKVAQLERSDIDQLIQIASNTKNQTTDFTTVKIHLYEKKQDYSEAFMQYLNKEEQRQEIFVWLSDLIKKLKKEEIEWKRENGYQDEIVPEPEPDKEKDEDEEDKNDGSESDHTVHNCNHDGHEEDDDEKRLKGLKLAHAVSLVEDLHPYPPLQNLKHTVKDRMLKLAQYNCEQTITLIENHFSEGDFQERLIMNQFSHYPKEQMTYLTKLISKNEREIELTMQDRTHNPQMYGKYERYLVQFTKLICSQDEKSVEKWVSKTYFPVEKCLAICQESHKLGEAILTMRNGRPHAAIDLYCQILTDFPILSLLEQVKLLYKDEPNFLQELINEDDDVDDDMSRFQSTETFNAHALTQISEFDSIIGKACQICMLDELDIEERQKAWFQILRYLQQFKAQADKKCDEAIREAVSQLGDEKYSSINQTNKHDFIKKLEKFIDVRIEYILRFPQLAIPLKIVVEKLNLTIDQIKNLTSSKLKHSGTTFWIEQTQNIIGKNQLCDMFKDTVNKRGTGFLVEPQKRIQSKGGRKKCSVSSICCLCINSITAETYLVVYQCGHAYHNYCLKKKQKENESTKCPLCLKIDYQAYREELENLIEAQLKKQKTKFVKAKMEEFDGEEDDNLHQYGDFNEDVEDDMAKFHQNMISKKMDQFDVILDDINLELSEFDEEMMEVHF